MLCESQKGIRNSVLRDYKEISIRATGQVEATILAAQQSLELAAAIVGTIHAQPWKVETAIVELSLKYPIFKRISMVDPSGKEVVSSDLGAESLNFSNNPALNTGLKGKVYLSDVRISNDHVPLMTMGVPVYERGRIVAVLIAELSLRGIWSIIDSIQVGHSGFAYLVDSRGTIIAHPDKKMVLENAQVVYPELLTIGLKDNDSREVLSGLVMSYARIRMLNWLLVIEQPKKEAMSFLAQMQKHARLLIIVAILACVLFSFWMANFLSRPMRVIMDATRHLARGEFPSRFPIYRRDEIGRLLFSFNRMIVKMRIAQEIEKFSIVGKAATTIAHELKNSLVLVKTFIQILPERHRDPQFIKNFSQTIPKELDTWNLMLQSMMDFSKTSKLDLVSLNVNQVIMDVVDLSKFRAAQKNIGVVTEYEPHLPEITGDHIKLKQAFLNLVSNAIDATPEGGKIKLFSRLINAVDSSSCSVEISVQNSGPGIAQEQLARIFEPFFTTKKSGLGLGLAISREIIQQHKGEIRVVSVPNQYTEFIVSFWVGHPSIRLQEKETLTV